MNRSLLIVANDLDQLELLTRRFICAGYQVRSAHHPQQALKAARFRQFQVAIIDASPPEIDGLELLRRLQRMQDGVQVILLSEMNYPGSHEKANGAFACLAKPCKMELLEAVVEDAFDRTFEGFEERVPPKGAAEMSHTN